MEYKLSVCRFAKLYLAVFGNLNLAAYASGKLKFVLHTSLGASSARRQPASNHEPLTTND
jgi:hypothetical protein